MRGSRKKRRQRRARMLREGQTVPSRLSRQGGTSLHRYNVGVMQRRQ